MEFVVMRVGETSVTAALTDLAEIIDGRNIQIRALPNLPPPYLGITRRCGHVIPIIDVASLIGLPHGKESRDSGQVSVMNLQSETVGLFVDEISTIISATSEEIATLAPGSWSTRGLVMTRAIEVAGGQVGIIEPVALAQALSALVPRRSG